MSLWKIAWRSIQQRGLASILTTFSMALGVMLVVAVLSVHGVVSESFRNNTSLGYDLIAGAKGGKLQLTLNTVYYLSQPVENVPYDFYLEFSSAEQRQEQLRHSLAHQVHTAQWEAIQAASLTGGTGTGMSSVGKMLGDQALKEAESERLDLTREGKYSQFTALAVPLCLGDYFGQFRVVGTIPEMFDKLTFGRAADKKYEFAEGRNFKTWTEENGYFEAVLGATVARETGVGVGDGISPSHGDPDGEGHDQQFTVVGVLEPSGTPNDRAVFINIEGFYLMDDHSKPVEKEEEEEAEQEEEEPQGFAALGITPAESESEDEDEEERAEAEHGHDHDDSPRQPLPVEQREVTSILVRTVNPLVGATLPNLINEGPVAQCLAPIREITMLFEFIVGPIQQALLAVTALVCLVSGISILVSIYNSMSDRKHEIAVMRALGASRTTVLMVVLVEAIILSLAGGAIGWTAAHSLNALASPLIEARTGVTIGFLDMGPWYFWDPKEALAEQLPSASQNLLQWITLAVTAAAVVAAALAVAGALALLWLAFKRHLGWGIAGLCVPPALYVFGLLSAETSQGVRRALASHFTGLLGLGLASLYIFGVPFNIELVLIPGLTLLAVVVGFLPALAAYRTDVAESLGV